MVWFGLFLYDMLCANKKNWELIAIKLLSFLANKTKGLKLHRHHLSISSTKIFFFHELQIYLGITIRSILISNFIYWSITIRSIYLSITIRSIYLSIYHHSLHLSIYHHSLHPSIYISPFAPFIYLYITIRSIYLSIYLSPFAPSIYLSIYHHSLHLSIYSPM